MKTQAVILPEAGQRLLVDEIELPDPGEGQVLVRNLASVVCHSQLHQMRAPGPYGRPLLLGHEATSEVVAVGPGVRHLQPGQRVLLTTPPPATVAATEVGWMGAALAVPNMETPGSIAAPPSAAADPKNWRRCNSCPKMRLDMVLTSHCLLFRSKRFWCFVASFSGGRLRRADRKSVV